MEGDFDQFEEVDDDFLSSVCLNLPCEVAPETVVNKQCDSSSSNAVNVNDHGGASTSNHQGEKQVLLEECVTPDEFAFPFEPYDIQVGFMKNLYKALELGKIGIFESPTGTGKSLSLICGALRWLKDFEEKEKRELELLLEAQKKDEEKKKREKAEEVDWISAFTKKKEDEEKTNKLKNEQELMQKREARLKKIGMPAQVRARGKRKRNVLEDEFDELFKDAPSELKNEINAELDENDTENPDLNDDVLLAEYLSDDEKTAVSNADSDSDNDDEAEDDHVTKIYYCSRTHSQLAQFVHEVIKSPHGTDTRVVTLGSRQNMCVNESVKRLQNLSLINDKCIELQKNKSGKKSKNSESVGKKKKTSEGCPYYKHEAITGFRDKILLEIKDVEQLVGMGRKLKACPYYSTRYAVPTAQIVALPYNTLLHRSTRESSKIKLKDSIVIIDEAHNLVDTISNVHSIEITGNQITCAHSQLTQYMDRFRTRLKAKNLMYIKQLLFILGSFIKCLDGQCGIPAEQQKLPKQETKLLTINDFLFASQLDNMNLFKILHYCRKSEIAKKLHGFVEKYQPTVTIRKEVKEEKPSNWALSNFLKEMGKPKTEEEKGEKNDDSKKEDNVVMMSSPLMHILGFLEALTNTNTDGRIVTKKEDLLSKSSLKFLLLNPAVHFAEVIKEARAVIVAGGTMQPLSEFKDQLFFATGVSPERILEYSCGHVIPSDQILPIALARGPSGQLLDFTYHSRDLPQVVEELGRVLYNISNAVPGGVVCFFPSYEYEKNVYAHWEKSGHLEKISAKKKNSNIKLTSRFLLPDINPSTHLGFSPFETGLYQIFREPKKSSQVDSILGEYTQCIKKHLSNKYSQYTGAILFSVVGGKMSEGINFSDELGRCVVMVGLPYPNIRSPELKEKMDYLNANMPKSPDGKLPGQVHYENLCMKAVNQSIGRAIRHKGDYASMLLLDHRYLKPGIQAKLPSWISGQVQNMERFGPAFAAVRKFFINKDAQES